LSLFVRDCLQRDVTLNFQAVNFVGMKSGEKTFVLGNGDTDSDVSSDSFFLEKASSRDFKNIFFAHSDAEN